MNKGKRILASLVICFVILNILPVDIISGAEVTDSNEVQDTVNNSSEDITIKLVGLGMEGVEITLLSKLYSNIQIKEKTNEEGIATFKNMNIDDEYYVYISDIQGYEYYFEPLKLDENNYSEIEMKQIEKCTLTYTFIDENGNPVQGVTVNKDGYELGTKVLSNEDGVVSIELYKGKNYKIEISKENEIEKFIINENIIGNQEKTINLSTIKYSISADSCFGVEEINTIDDILYGESREVIITALEGYEIDTVYVNGSEVAIEPYEDNDIREKCKIKISNITENKKIFVGVISKTYNVNFKCDNNGNMLYEFAGEDEIASVGGTVTVNHDQDLSFIINVKDLFHVSSIKVDGEEVDLKDKRYFEELEDNRYRFSIKKINKDNISIEVKFDVNKSNVSIKANNGIAYVNNEEVTSNFNNNCTDPLEIKFKPNNTNNTLKSLKVNNENVVITEENFEFKDGIYKFKMSTTEDKYNVVAEFGNPTVVNDDFNKYIDLDFSETSIVDSNQEDLEYVLGNEGKVNLNSKLKNTLIALNSEGNFTSIISIEDSKVIEEIYVYTIGELGFKKINLDKKLSLEFDKESPIFVNNDDKIVTFDYSNNTCTMSQEKCEIKDVGKAGLSEIRYSTVQDDFSSDSYKNMNNRVTSVKVDDNNNYSFELSDNNTYYMWIYDKAGNKSESYITIIPSIDKQKPILSDANRNYEGEYTNKSVVITGKCKDDGGSGILEVKYSNSIEDYESNLGKEANIEGDMFNFEISNKNENNSKYYIWAIDGASNKSDYVEIDVQIDINKPTIEILSKEAADWSSYDSVEVKIKAEDKLGNVKSNVDKIMYSNKNNIESVKDNWVYSAKDIIDKENLEQYSLNVDLTQFGGYDGNLYFWAIDKAGNVSEVATYSIKSDYTMPEVDGFEINGLNSTKEKIINVLTFGIFYNDKFSIRVKIKDEEVSSGINNVILFYYDEDGEEKKIESNSIIKGKDEIYAEFILECGSYKNIKCIVTDNADNESKLTYASEGNTKINGEDIGEAESEKGIGSILVEKSKPNINTKLSEKPINEKWYSDELYLEFELSDEESGLNDVSIYNISKNNGEETIEYKNYSEEVMEKADEIKLTELYKYINEDGSCTIKIIVNDNAGNSSEEIVSFNIDNQAPIITNMTFSKPEGIEVIENTESNDYKYFFNTDTELVVTIDDNVDKKGKTSGLKDVKYILLDKEVDDINNAQSEVAEIENGKAKVKIPMGFKGKVYLFVSDNVGNVYKDGYISIDKIIIENEELHKENSSISFTINGVEPEDNIYNDNILVNVKLTDTLSGVNKIEWVLKDGEEEKSKGSYKAALLPDKNTLEKEQDDNWFVVKKDTNLVTEIDGEIAVENSSVNNILTVKLTDNAGNITERTINLEIDKEKPIISEIKSDNTNWTNDSIKISIKSKDEPSGKASGVKYVKYSTNLGDYTSDDFNSDKIKKLDVNTSGKSTLNINNDKSCDSIYYFWCYDEAGNKSDVSSIEVKIDVENPKLTTNKDKYDYSNSNVEIEGKTSDEGGSKVKEVGYSLTKDDYENGKMVNKAKLKEDGTYTLTVNKDDKKDIESVYVWCYDNAGNKSEAKMVTVNIDTTIPKITSATIESNGELVGDWYNISNKEVVFKVETSDVDGINSDISKIVYSNGKNTVILVREKDKDELKSDSYVFTCDLILDEEINSFNGDYTFYVYDNAGNMSSEFKKPIKYDFEDPTVNSIKLSNKESLLNKVLRYLTFGIYSNKDLAMNISVTDDVNGSTVKEVKVKYKNNDEEKEVVCTKDQDNNFICDLELNNKYEDIKVYAIDVAGNDSELTSIDEISEDDEIESDKILLESSAPEIEFEMKDDDGNIVEGYKDSKERIWFANDINIYSNVVDNDSGIWKAELFNDKELEDYRYSVGASTSNDLDENKLLSKDEVTNSVKLTHKVNEKQGYGKQTISVSAEDNSGNISSSNLEYYIDTQAPTIKSVSYNNDTVSKVNDLKYGYFYNKDTKITITAEDKGNLDEDVSSGIKSIEYYLVDYSNSSTGKKGDVIKGNLNGNSISFNIPANFKGQVFVKVTDNVGNTTGEFIRYDGIIVENQDMHNKTSKVEIKKATTDKKDREGLDLYSGDVPVEFVVEDSYSGIKEVQWKIITNSGVEDHKIEVNNTKPNDADCSFKKDANIVTSISKKIVVNNNSNGIKVYVKLTDNAGNSSEKEIRFSIDKTKPTIEVQYDNNNYDSQFISETEYYKENRTATVTITERNFNSNDVKFTITNKDGNVPSHNGWQEIGSANEDERKYVTTIVYSEDGDYTFDVEFQDLAGNKADDYAMNKFTIDKTNPELSISFDNNNFLNQNYFKDSRTATVTIVEHNFDPSRVVVHGNITGGVNNGYPQIGSWSSVGDRHTASITYSTDGVYTLDVDYVDKAGNKAADVAEHNFCIDLTSPKLTIEGVADKSSNNGKVIPVISYSDTNFDANNVTISLNGVNNGKTNIVGEYVNIENGQSFTFKDFDKLESVDDIYSLEAVVVDKAGNETKNNIAFSVNRFGSKYIFDSSLTDILGKYYKEERDIKITELNVDDLDLDSLNVKVTKNGVPTDLNRNLQYEINKTSNEGEWSKYEYNIDSSVFKDDGIYIVTLSSKDMAGNLNQNIDEEKRAEVWFGIDKTAPVIVPIGLESKNTYAVDSKEVTVSITDNLSLNKVKVYLNNKEVDYVKEGDNFIFNIDSSNSSQNLKIVATDEAGNEIIKEVNDFYVTTSVFIRVFTNATILTSTIVISAILIAGIFITVRYVRRRG